jgi:hypothetical protein
MKKINILLILVMVTVLLISAAPKVKLMRLEIINKSAFDTTIKFEEYTPFAEDLAFEYITVKAMDSFDQIPVIGTFTFVRGLYNATAWYCGQVEPKFFQYDFTKSKFRITIPPCDIAPEGGSEENSQKLSPFLYPVEDDEVYAIGAFKFNWRY